MTQCNLLNVKLCKWRLNKLKNGAEVILKNSSNLVCDFNDENDFPHKLLLAITKVSKLCKAFANGSPANTTLSKTQLHKIGHSGEFS